MRSIPLALLVGVSLMLASCESKPARSPVFPTTGRVTQSGKPVVGATVILHPLAVGEPTAGALKPRGTTDAEGTFKLTTYGADDGAPAGKYRVTVELWATLKPEEGPQNRLPGKFGKPDTSKLDATVEAKPTDLAVIELGK